MIKWKKIDKNYNKCIEVNIGEVYSDMDVNYSDEYSNNTDVDNIQQNIKDTYTEDKGELNVFSDNYDENESLIMNTSYNDDNTDGNGDYE